MAKGIYRTTFILICLLANLLNAAAQSVTLNGLVIDNDNQQPIEFASILIKDNGQWAITDEKGHFTLKNVAPGQTVLTVQCLGYATQQLTINTRSSSSPVTIRMKPENLRLDEVTVTARRKHDEATTSYTIDRAALDQQQLLNISDIETLLPGGKTVNATLMNDDRLALRSGSQEKGNASFGTAIEVDGMRLDNNAAAGETMAASTRGISSSNIESVEIVTGIPSVEYGDLSNGIVKVNTRRGKSPFIVEGKINQHTRQIALNKGFDLGHNSGILNASIEHARSFSDAASPHTAYQRNILSLHYMNVFMQNSMPLTLNVGLTGNIGGYNSEADPDEDLEDYSKARDNQLRANFELYWLVNRRWLTNLSLRGSLSYADRLSESYTHSSSASTQPYIHATEEGYHIAENLSPDTPTPDIILSPTGYWYVQRYNDSKPVNWSLKLKGEQNTQLSTLNTRLRNHLMAGAEYTGSKNNGRGTYYEDMRYAPTWREYRYDELPAMHNLAFYIEDKVSIPTSRHSTFELTAGLRDDITLISGSDYGTVNSLSPRVNSRYIFWSNLTERWVSDLTLHAGWGKSVKLPSFQVLYPAPAYADRLAFASTSTDNNTSYYAYHTYPTKAVYNPGLRWQYTNQADLGIEATVKGTRISLSAFWHRTHRSYMSTDSYTPMTYLYTPPSALEDVAIDVNNRQFAIDQQTGIVTVSDATGAQPSQQLAYNQRNTYAVNSQYVNGSPVNRYGIEWAIDFAQIQALRTSLRIDGNYYHYKGIDDVFFADIPQGVSSTMTGNQPYQYVGWYRGSNVTGAGSSASASVTNGALTRQVNLNATITTHIPQIRLIVALRLETSLYNYRRSLSEFDDGTRGYVLNSSADYFGQPYDGTSRDQLVAVYPEYYTTWDDPTTMIPFAEKFTWAKENDAALYSDLSKLVVRTNYPYVMNPNRISSYYSANLSVTKEIGDHVSISFYANNFFNNMKTVNSSQTNLDTSLFGSSYIPSFYYGLSLRLKL